MEIKQDVSLSNYSTMRLGGKAAYLCQINSRNELTEALAWASDKKVPYMMIGTGSNIVWKDAGFPGLVMVNRIMGYEPFKEDEENYYITVGAGENWDSVVKRSVEAGATGIEGLSLVPGAAGATPIQNVGAYGQEISQTLVTVEAYDSNTRQFVNVPNQECNFSYRSSRFNTTDRGRFLVTGMNLHLRIGNPQPPFYSALDKYLKEHHITEVTPVVVRQAVINIRQAKLPDPSAVANNGSFFWNPIVSKVTFDELLSRFPDIVHWSMGPDKVKISAAWLVEKAGFKDFHDNETGMGTWPKHSLILVNEHAKTTADVLKFKQKIIDEVHKLSGITLKQEPELLP